MSYDTFVLNTARMEAWAPLVDSPLIVLLREISELRKLNNSLMKVILIDDLICDTFACLYEQVVPDLIVKSNDEENRDRMRVDHLMNSDVPSIDAPSPAPSNQGTSEQAAPRSRPKIVSRREILRKAEVLVNIKPVPPPTNRPPTTAISVLVPSKDLSSPLPNPTELAISDAFGAGDVNKEIPSSVPGSVHDSADDESELSDIEEVAEIEVNAEEGSHADKDDAVEEVPEETPPAVPPMFPGLIGRSGIEGDETGGEDEEEEVVEEDRNDDDKDVEMVEGEGEGEGDEEEEEEDVDMKDDVRDAETEEEG